MPDALPTQHVTDRGAEREVKRLMKTLDTAMLEERGLAVALDVLSEALGGVAALVRHVPVSGPVRDDRDSIAFRDVELEETLALALWWNSPAACEALGRLPAGGVIEHGRWRRVPAALRQAVTLILDVEQQGFCSVTLWRRTGARRLTARHMALLTQLGPPVARAIAGELLRPGAAQRAGKLGKGVLFWDCDVRVPTPASAREAFSLAAAGRG